MLLLRQVLCCVYSGFLQLQFHVLQGSAEATSTTWPERPLQGSSSVSGHALTGQPLHSHSLSQQAAADRTSVPAAAQSSNGVFPGHMWAPAGVLTHYVSLQPLQDTFLASCCYRLVFYNSLTYRQYCSTVSASLRQTCSEQIQHPAAANALCLERELRIGWWQHSTIS